MRTRACPWRWPAFAALKDRARLQLRSLALLRERFPVHRRCRRPRRVRQLGDEKFSQGGHLCRTRASCRRYEIQPSLRKAPISKNWLKLILGKILRSDKFREFANCQT